MYGALWSVLPGPTWARVLMLVLTGIIVVLVLFEWVFPWVSEILPYQEQTVSES
jgi:hypothetical protein